MLGVARRAGLLDPIKVAATGAGFARWGMTLGAAVAGAAIRHPRRAAVIDDRGALSYSDLDRRSTALGGGLRESGLEPGDHLAILCRNHRGFVEASVGAAKASLRPVYMNTGFGAPQLDEVLAREGTAALVCDEEFVPLADESSFSGPVIVADGRAGMTLHDVRGRAKRRSLGRPEVLAPVMLTSGTTGTPKGARYSKPADLGAALGLLERLPVRSGDVFIVAPPLFHAWGLAQMSIAISLGATMAMRPRFDPESTVDLVREAEGSVLAVVPVMLQRILAAGLDLGPLTDLRIVASSGSALPGPVTEEWHMRVGHNLYNLYGSTEVGPATIADPDDLRHAVDTAGRVIPGSTVVILDDDGGPLPRGDKGRIFVGNANQFDQYTGGGGKEVIDGLMSSGDVGYLDDAERLFVTGRADDMIVSGGENVFPREVEEHLLAMDGVVDVAVVGVEDDEFGQRLAAFVVREGSSLTKKAIRDSVKESLARHKVPRDVHWVEEIPRTTTGKILRRNLQG